MTNEDIKDALNRIDSQLESGYLDISDWPDEAEMNIVRDAITEYRANHNL